MLSVRFQVLGIPKDAIIYADSAEPKSIAELVNFGWNVVPTVKGPDSIRAGLDTLLAKEVAYTEESEHIRSETENYRWALDRNKLPTNTPVDKFNHLMDALRGGIFTQANQPYIGFA